MIRAKPLGMADALDAVQGWTQGMGGGGAG